MEKTSDSGELTSLAKLRGKTGKTQRQISFEVGVSEKTVAAWEKGSIPALDKAVRLADSLGISLDELCEAFNLRPASSHNQGT